MSERGTSETTTEGVVVRVRSAYVPEKSSDLVPRHFFVYHITVENRSDETVQLVSRHWIITDGKGEVEEVKGLGVVGKQPVLDPGDEFQYSSYCPLETTIGSMEGWFRMQRGDGSEFDARVETFTLAAPYAIN